KARGVGGKSCGIAPLRRRRQRGGTSSVAPLPFRDQILALADQRREPAIARRPARSHLRKRLRRLRALRPLCRGKGLTDHRAIGVRLRRCPIERLYAVVERYVVLDGITRSLADERSPERLRTAQCAVLDDVGSLPPERRRSGPIALQEINAGEIDVGGGDIR